MKSCLFFCMLFLNHLDLKAQVKKIYAVKTGKVFFQSTAPFETIKAASNELKGLLDTQQKNFAFKIGLESFEGFNSSMQREHFNENYVESNKYPEAAFSGKIIEDIDFAKEGTYTVRAKGKFAVHGVTQERIIKSTLIVKNKTISIASSFSILLPDYNIPIPKVVKDKLSSEINVQINCLLEPH